jgi:hypothetical protein
MRLVGQGAGPSVEDAQDTNQAAHLVRLQGEGEERLGRSAQQHVVQVLLVAADEFVELLRQRPDHMTVGHGSQILPPRCQPHLGVLMMALGTTPIAAGMVGIMLLPAVITRQQMATQDLGPAVHDLIHGTAMTGQQIRAEPLLIGGTVGPEDVRHLWHARTPTRLEVGHEGVDGGVYHVEGFARQMRVARGGTGTLVPEEFLDDAPRHAPLSEMGGIGVPQRVNRGVFGEATLTHHALKGLLQGSRRERRLLVPSGEQPGPGARPLPV